MTTGAPAAPRLTFLLGRADDMRAEVYVRLAGGPSDARITGTLTGPRCRLATTLPSTMPLHKLPGRGPAAARAIVTEPSFWTPELPNLYELVAEARTASGVVVATRQLVGLRRLGPRGRSIWLEGRRWVPRAGAAAAAFDPASFHAAGLAAMLVDPTVENCAAADAAGVAIVARLDSPTRGAHDAPASADRAAAWSQHPSVVMLMLDVNQLADVAAHRGDIGTMLVGCVVDAAAPPPDALPPGSDCLVARLDPHTMPAAAWRERAPAAPIVAWRRQAGDGGRRACDALQAELAAWGCAGGGTPAWDWAGYVVT